jgi:hypothetical protein
MFRLRKRIGVLLMVGLTSLAWSTPRGNAQSPGFVLPPHQRGLTLGQATFNIARIGQALSFIPPYTLGFNPYPRTVVNPLSSASVTPYAGASVYSSPYAASYANPYDSSYGSSYGSGYYDYFGGYLRGGANVITSQAQFTTSRQQAYLAREQVRSERIANRRKVFDQYLYEREKTPTAEDERQNHQLEQLNRSRNAPPVTEIWSGKALNDLLTDLKKIPARPPAAEQLANLQQLPLDEDGLKHINVTQGAGNIGLLKNEGRLDWPVALSGPEYREQRERVSSLAQAAVRQAEFNGRVDGGTITQLTNDLDSLQRQLRKNSGDLSFATYTEAKTFLSNLDAALSSLRQRDVGNHFTGKFALKAKTVPELVEHMTQQGLQFAPAVPGDEAAYTALHQALANYDVAARAQTASR